MIGWLMSEEEKHEASVALKDQGNKKFKENKYKEAEELYVAALEQLEAIKRKASPLT